MEECLGLTADIASITEWLTTEQVFEVFGMKPTAIHAYAYRHRIPTKKEYGILYYSKTHLDELRQTDLMEDERYCTVEYVSEKYGLSKANIHHICQSTRYRETESRCEKPAFPCGCGACDG